MKRTKLFGWLLLLLVSILSFVACSGEENTEGDCETAYALVGSWIEMDVAEPWTIEFRADGTGTESGYDYGDFISDEFTWSADHEAGLLTIVYLVDNEQETGKFTINDDILTVRDADNGEITGRYQRVK